MLWQLLIKDLKRARHNPWPYVINLALPLCITALIGLVFGPSAKGGGIGQIKLAVVDQDDSVLSSIIRGGMNQGEAKKYLTVSFLDRSNALQQINANKISAVLIIPHGFTKNYLTGAPVTFELIKNPAQSVYPAMVEELMQVLVAALNAVSRNLQADLPEWMKVFDENGKPDMEAITKLVARFGQRIDAVPQYLFPPLVGYTKETRAGEKKDGVAENIFAFMLPGLVAMFLFFLADHSIRDLYREMQMRTFDRFRTVRHRVLAFIVSKVVLAMVVLLAASAILFGGGALIFGIQWEHVMAMLLLIVAFALFASGFMAFVAALARNERRADVLNSVLIMMIAFIGGSFFPARQLPGLMRDHISPLMPNYWFIESIRVLQGQGAGVSWTLSAIKLAVAGAVLVFVAALIFQRMLGKGARG